MQPVKTIYRRFVMYLIIACTVAALYFPGGSAVFAQAGPAEKAAAPSQAKQLYATADSFRFPLDGTWQVILDFGGTNPRFSGKHLGEDASAGANTPLYAVANGLVKENGYHNAYMHVVIIEHTLGDSSKVTSVYGHMKADGIIPVGTEVSKGQLIGYLDTSAGFAANGYSPHEHFGIRKGGYSSTWVYYGYEYGSETMANWYDPSTFIYSHQSGGSTCPSPSNGLPRDNTILNNNQVTFSWSPPSCSGIDYYTFRVSNHSDIDNPPWIIDHGVSKDTTNISENIPSGYNGQTLYWAIWPHNGAGYGSKGGPWQFKVDTSNPPPPPPLPTGSWSVQYFRNKELTDQCSTTSFDRTFIFQDWGDGAPVSGCNSDNWGARFTRRVTFQGGNYSFAVEADDWGRIYVDGNLFVDKWNGASQHYEGYYVPPGDHDVRVEFADTLGGAKISAWWWGPGFEIPHETQDPNQWFANYWINPSQWWDAFASRNEGSGILYHEWGYDDPGWDMPPDGFSARFQRTVNFECGTYRFMIDHDDGAKFWMDNQLKIDRWSGPIGYYDMNLFVPEGPHLLQVDQYENGGSAHISFNWERLSGCNPPAPSPQGPYDNQSLQWDTDLTLSWSASNGATQYFAQLSGGSGVEITSDWISGTQWHVGGLWPGVYTWSVTARNDSGSSGPSQTSMFTIQEPATANFSYAYLPAVMNTQGIKNVQINADANDLEIGNLECSSWSVCRDTGYASFLLHQYAQGTVAASKEGAGKYTLKRIYLFFDTSRIPLNATIRSVELHIYTGSYVNGPGTIHVVNTTSSIPATGSDFGSASLSTAAGSFTPAANTWAAISFNPAGLNWIKKGSFTRLGLVQDADFSGYAPSGLYDAVISLSEDPQHPPYLVINYTE